MNSTHDDMTNQPDLYQATGKTIGLPFESTDYEKAGIRLLPAQLARVCGVSKQAVSTWVKKGRVVLGSDGRVDPRQAFDRLAATGDITKLRLKILEPFRREVAERDRRIADLEVAVTVREREIERLRYELAMANESADFEEASALGYIGLLDDLMIRLRADWSALALLHGMQCPDAIEAWLDDAKMDGSDREISILDYIPVGPGDAVEGAGD